MVKLYGTHIQKPTIQVAKKWKKCHVVVIIVCLEFYIRKKIDSFFSFERSFLLSFHIMYSTMHFHYFMHRLAVCLCSKQRVLPLLEHSEFRTITWTFGTSEKCNAIVAQSDFIFMTR